MCVNWWWRGGKGGGGSYGAKATESGLNTSRTLSLKVCQRVHGGRRPSKNTIMGFDAFHLGRERTATARAAHSGLAIYQSVYDTSEGS